jgi:2-aminobenzoate-CoA ligase
VWEDFHRATGVRIIDGIGATEMLHIFISAADQRIRPGATGVVVPGYEAAVLGEDGKPVPDGEPGRLAVKGPTGCRYLADERQRSYVFDGWNLTGDTYARDADGYYWYQARSDDMIITAGYNIAGPEVEQALLGHPDVAEAGVVAAPDADRGTIVKAYVVLREGAAAGQSRRTPGLHQTGDRPLQVPPRDRVRGRPPPYQHRQAPALPPPPASHRSVSKRAPQGPASYGWALMTIRSWVT